jgi:hypothetical protein
MIKAIPTFTFLILLFSYCQNKLQGVPALSSKEIPQVVEAMTDLMVHDITNPPLAARFFAYACLAGYEVLAQHDSHLRPMNGVLNEFPKIEKPKIDGECPPSVSAVLAMLETAQKMQPSGSQLESYEKRWLDSLANSGFSQMALDNALKYAQAISQQILAYAKADRYNRISNFPRYTPAHTEGSWYPTPPGYFAAVEPYFHTIRSFTLDTAHQFKPMPPTPFSKAKNSPFFALVKAVYDQKLSAEQQEVAAFWDCNPFALQDNGHLQVGQKKISPGAHWMGITAIACAKSKANFSKTLEVHTLVAIGLMDGFLCCWDEKYRSNRVRPETAIRQYIDPNWRPFLQTPPFPEYLSGHSTISSAAATILTAFFGDSFGYTDTVENRYGLPSRSFQSFKQAAAEAGLSRFYGGIHFMDAIENGQKQGELVGQNVLQKYQQ